uniref:Choline transporter-like protein n=1 Tax=Amphiprion ocellaris TaxID=80972 RepID=A0AAQ5YW23_AMPOC
LMKCGFLCTKTKAEFGVVVISRFLCCDFTGYLRSNWAECCTDIICCVLFLLVVLGYIAVGILAWLFGDPRHVLYPRNSTGWYCGIGPNDLTKNLNNFLFFSFPEIDPTCSTLITIHLFHNPQVCVEQCPSDFYALEPSAYFRNPADVFNASLCVPSIDLRTTTLSIQQIVDQELCPFFYIPTTPGEDVVNGFSTRDIGMRIFEDFASSWPWILVGLLIAMLVSMLFLLLLRFIAPIMVWVLIIGVLVAGAYGIWHCYWEYENFKDTSISDVGLTTNFKTYLQVQETWLTFLIIISVVEVIILLTVIFLRTRILIAIALIQESSKAISHMMSALLYPLVTFVLLLVCVAYWGAMALYLATSGDPIYKVVALNTTMGDCGNINGTANCEPESFSPSDYPGCPSVSCIFIKYNEEGLLQENLMNLQIYNAVAFLWCVNFVIALGQCTLAGAFASYYWAFNKPNDIPTFPVCGGFMRSLRYHVGSLAFGALILTLVQVIRIILEYIDHKARAQNRVARFIMTCFKCCFWCLEKFIKFLNRNAYIMIAIYGKNFCVSAKNAFMLLMRNVIRVVVLDKVTDLLLFFGKLLVVGGVGVLSFYFFSGRIALPGNTFRSSSLNYYWMPIITVAFGSYLIAHGFFSVYNMCVDTLFLCFLEDLERNDGSMEKPYFMSKSLMKILNKSNKTLKKHREN